MTPVLASADFRTLRGLAAKWRGERRPQAADDLSAALNEIEARRAPGGDVFVAEGTGNSVPEIHARACLKAADLWGLDASVAVEKTGAVHETLYTSRGRYQASVTLRCLNYAEISS